MYESAFIHIGIFVILFIACVSLLIFAPRCVNYYGADTYPILNYLHENNLQTIKDDNSKIKNSDDWLIYPDNIHGTCKIFPIYMFSTLSKKRKKICVNTYNLIKNTPDIKTCAFINIQPNSQIDKGRVWGKLSNETLRVLFVIDSPSTTIEKCGMCVNDEYKKIKPNSLIIFDGSKEHTIYNKTDSNIELLLFDISRPVSIPHGSSDREYTKQILEFIYDLSQESKT